MKRRRALLLAILLYLSLDVSLPSMPGAFEFDPADSVESVHSTRVRMAGDVILLPAFPMSARVVSQLIDVRPRPAALRETALVGHRVVNRLPRATSDPARPSEDPH